MNSLKPRSIATLVLMLYILIGLFAFVSCNSEPPPIQSVAATPATPTTGKSAQAVSGEKDQPTHSIPTPIQTYPPVVNPSYTVFPSSTPVPYTPGPLPTSPPPPPATSIPTSPTSPTSTVPSVTSPTIALPTHTAAAGLAGSYGYSIAWGVETTSSLTIWLGTYSDIPTPNISNAKPIAHWDTPLTLLDMEASPDGQFLAVLAKDVLLPGAEGLLPHWLSVIDLNTNKVQSIPDPGNSDLYREFYHAPPFRIVGWIDNNKLAVQQTGEGPVVATKDGMSYTRVLFQPGTASDTALSPDRTTFFSPLLDQGYKYGLWLYNVDGTNPRRILDNSSAKQVAQPLWSPDGRYISFLSARSELRNETSTVHTVRLWLLDPGAKLQKVVSADDSDLWDVGAAWSSDGSKIAFLRADAAVTGSNIPYDMPQWVNTNIVTADVNTLVLQKITNFSTVKNSGLQWTPNNNLVLSSTAAGTSGLPGLIAVFTSNGSTSTLLSGASNESLVHPLIFSR